MKNLKYIWLLLLSVVITSCEEDDLSTFGQMEPLPELTAGEADFSNYVALGASFTAGFTDNALFIASQENSFPNTLSKEFAKIGGGAFTQPLMSDNFGGLAIGGTRITDPRLVFGGAGPVPLEAVIGPVTVSTDIALNNPTGPFNNLGVPGAKSFHYVAPGYGNIVNFPVAANPYAVRMTGSTPDATLAELAAAQGPSFFTLSEFGGNDVLGYATSGGDGSNPITDTGTFDFTLAATLDALTANGAKGAIGNVPNITSLSYFTTVPFNSLDPSNPDVAAQIPTLNTLYGALNGVFAFLQSQGAINDAAARSVVFSTTEANPLVIFDESLANISTLITQTLLANPDFPAFIAQFGLPPEAAPQVAGLLGIVYGQSRSATAADLVVLPSASVIGTVNEDFAAFLGSQGLPPTVAAQFSAEGVTLPLEDKWILTPVEQAEVAAATDAYNNSIAAQAQARGLALVDLKSVLEQAASTGIQFDDFNLNTSLVFGGLVSLDGVHLTARGYALMANSFLDAIDATYGSNFRASGNTAKANDFVVSYSPLLQ